MKKNLIRLGIFSQLEMYVMSFYLLILKTQDLLNKSQDLLNKCQDFSANLGRKIFQKAPKKALSARAFQKAQSAFKKN